MPVSQLLTQAPPRSPKPPQPSLSAGACGSAGAAGGGAAGGPPAPGCSPPAAGFQCWWLAACCGGCGTASPAVGWQPGHSHPARTLTPCQDPHANKLWITISSRPGDEFFPLKVVGRKFNLGPLGMEGSTGMGVAKVVVMEVLCDNPHQRLVGTDQDHLYNTLFLLWAQPRDPVHTMGGWGLGPAHLHLRHDQALHLPLAGIQCSLQLHAVLVAPGHALG